MQDENDKLTAPDNQNPSQPQNIPPVQVPQQPIQSSQVTPTMPESNKTSSKKPLLLVVAAVVVLVVVGTIGWMIYSNSQEDKENSKATSANSEYADKNDPKALIEPGEEATISEGTGIYQGADIVNYKEKEIPKSYPSFLPKFKYDVTDVQKVVLGSVAMWNVTYATPAGSDLTSLQNTLEAELKKQGFVISESSYPSHIQIDDYAYQGKKYTVVVNILRKDAHSSPYAIVVTSLPEE